MRAALAVAELPASRLHGLGFVDQQLCLQLRELTLALEAKISSSSRPTSSWCSRTRAGTRTTTPPPSRCRRPSSGWPVSRGQAPLVVEMTSYHRWGGEMRVGQLLPAATTETTCPLSPGERELKQRMLDCFRSQADVLTAFGVRSERFRHAPRYDFERPPHAGLLHYETLGWPTDGRHWCRNAAAALRALALPRVRSC